MWLAETRRIRDRKFILYEPKKHLIRAFAICRTDTGSYDLFPPIAGYRPFNSKAKRSYSVSPQRQHSDWSKLVRNRDEWKCRKCGESDHLEAHHIWPQQGFSQLRYIVENGITLCRSCHDNAYHAPEITPGQFLKLTSRATEINALIESPEFWSYYTAGLEKGRVLAYGLVTRNEIDFSDDQYRWFLSCAKLNNFVKMSKQAAEQAPITDAEYTISPLIENEIRSFDSFKLNEAVQNQKTARSIKAQRDNGLVIEDGTGITGAQSYANYADLVAYGRLRDVTVTAVQADGEALLIKAMDALQDRRWKGERATTTQALAWPRSGVYLACGANREYRELLPHDFIPRELIYGQLALAVDAIDHGLAGLESTSNKGGVAIQVETPVTAAWTNDGSVSDVAALASADTLLRVLERNSGLTLVSSAPKWQVLKR